MQVESYAPMNDSSRFERLDLPPPRSPEERRVLLAQWLIQRSGDGVMSMPQQVNAKNSRKAAKKAAKSRNEVMRNKNYPADQIAMIKRLEKNGTASFRGVPSVEGRLRVD
jgi:hypothetical protein